MKSIEEIIEIIREAFYEYGHLEFKRGKKVFIIVWWRVLVCKTDPTPLLIPIYCL
jgi:hypothetical protein